MTLLLHGLLFSVVLWGDSGARMPRMPEAAGAGANTGTAAGLSGERLILIQLTPDLSQSQKHAEEARLLAHQLKPTMLQITGPDSLLPLPIVTSEDGEEAQRSEADLIARTQLAGLYEGQIRARIERAWVRPRDALPEGAFACRARIHQDSTGAVTGVDLEKCNGAGRWQQSLVSAAFAASPLPAPPNPAVFVDAFSMGFQAVEFQEDGPEEGYESRGVLLAGNAPRAAELQKETQSSIGIGEKAPNGIIYLYGRGESLSWSTQAPPAPSLKLFNPTQAISGNETRENADRRSDH